MPKIGLSLEMKKKFLIIGSLAALTFLAYGNALFNGFVWDDEYLIVENPFIKHLQFIPKLFTGDLSSVVTLIHSPTGYYRPLSMMSFMVDYRLWSLNPFGYHLINVLVHLLNCLFVLLIAREITRNEKVGFLTSILFCIHPIHVEAVTPIFNRMGLQAALFMFASLYCFIWARKSSKPYLLVLVFLFFAAGLLSKEEAIVLPLIFASYDFFLASRTKLNDWLQWKNVRFYSLCILMCFVFLRVREQFVGRTLPFPFLNGDNVVLPALAGNILGHLATVVKLFGDYAVKMFFPFSLSPVYWIAPVQSVFDKGFWLGIAAGGLVVFAVWFWRKRKDVGFFSALFLICILPYLNIVPIAEAYTFHERFLYVASFAGCYFTAVALIFIDGKLKNSKADQLGRIGFAGLLACCLFFVAVSNYSWRTNLSLWRSVLSKSPQSRLARLNLGYVYLEKGFFNEAQIEIEKSLTPESPEFLGADTFYLANLNLGKIYTETGQYQKAQDSLQKAISATRESRINPFAAYDKLGILQAKLKRFDLAEESFKTALLKNENFVPTRYNLGVLYFENGQLEKAEKEFHAILRADPDFAHAAFSLGLIYLNQQKGSEAKFMFEETLRIDPKFQIAKDYLGRIKEF